MTVDGPIRPARRIRTHTRRPSQLPIVTDPASRPGVPGRFVRRVMAERHVRFYKIGRYLRTDGHNGDMDVDYDDVPESHAGGPDEGSHAAATAVRSMGGSAHDC
jgi:hypothetical protein